MAVGASDGVRDTRSVGRFAALAATAAVLGVFVALLLSNGGSSYRVHAIFQDASQIVGGDLVQVSGVPVGKVTNINLTADGRADLVLQIDDGSYTPLREGTIATVRQASLSGIANRYVDLRLPGANAPPIADGGVITETQTNSAVDLDALFNTFDAPTRQALSGVIRGFSTLYAGRSKDLSAGYLYLNPALVASSRLFDELNFDTPLLTRFVVASSSLVTDLASRQSDLSGLVDHLATATQAIGGQRVALADAIAHLPPFMRQADTTFVDLRSTLDNVTRLVDDSKPVAKKLRPFLHELRGFAHDARPTLQMLSVLLENPRVSNADVLSLINSSVPLAQIAVGPVQADGATWTGAFPASTQALGVATPELAYARPYAPELTSWFNSFSHSGVYDALGGASRVALFADVFSHIGGGTQVIPSALRSSTLQSLLTTNQRNRCPGAIEHAAADGSNPYAPPGFPCDPTQVPPGQ